MFVNLQTVVSTSQFKQTGQCDLADDHSLKKLRGVVRIIGNYVGHHRNKAVLIVDTSPVHPP